MNGMSELRSNPAPGLHAFPSGTCCLGEPGLPLPGREGLGGGGREQQAAGRGGHGA